MMTTTDYDLQQQMTINNEKNKKNEAHFLLATCHFLHMIGILLSCTIDALDGALDGDHSSTWQCVQFSCNDSFSLALMALTLSPDHNFMQFAVRKLIA
jgi:hypothetical protein